MHAAESKLLYIIWKIKSIFDRNLMSCYFFTFGCVTGWVYNFIFPQSSPVAHNFPLFDLATVLKSVPSIVSGQIPMVLKLKRQVWVAHSTSRNVIGLVIWRHTVAFPKNGDENWCFLCVKKYLGYCRKGLGNSNQGQLSYSYSKNSFPVRIFKLLGIYTIGGMKFDGTNCID